MDRCGMFLEKAVTNLCMTEVGDEKERGIKGPIRSGPEQWGRWQYHFLR